MSLTVFASFPAAHAEMARVKRRPFHHAGYLSVRCRVISYAPTPSDFPTRFAAMKHRSANVAPAAKHCIMLHVKLTAQGCCLWVKGFYFVLQAVALRSFD